jgi:nucleotide-binding universal stress UspA family protein
MKVEKQFAVAFWPLSKCRNVLTLAPSLEAYKFLRPALRAFPRISSMTQFFPQIRRVAAAITISPRMVAVLAAAWHFAKRLKAPLLVIHGGAPDAQKEAEFRDALFQLGMPRETRIVWNQGEPTGAIVTAAEKEGVDLLIAGALEGEKVPSSSFLGAVARPLAEQARCSLLLLTHPQIGPNPFRRIVVITDHSDCAKTALKNALWLAEADSAELVQVISIHTAFMQARAESGTEHEKPTRTREEEERVATRICGDIAGLQRFCRIQNRRFDDRLCRVRFYAINRRQPVSRARARAHERRRAIDDGLGPASDSVQSLDRAGKLTPDGLERAGCCRKKACSTGRTVLFHELLADACTKISLGGLSKYLRRAGHNHPSISRFGQRYQLPPYSARIQTNRAV